MDQDWAFDMENKIHDFFILHQYGANVRLENVNCKQSKCEIYGYYTDDIHFQLLSNELIIQPWFRATSTQSNSQLAEGSEKKFYTLVSF
mgnify:CR=1 FL=1